MRRNIFTTPKQNSKNSQFVFMTIFLMPKTMLTEAK